MSMGPTTRIIKLLAATAWLGLGCRGEPVNLDAVDLTSTSSTGSGSGEGTDESTGEQRCEWMPQELSGVFDPGPECRHLINLEGVAPIKIRLVNNGGSPLYLTTPSLCDPYYVAIRDADGRWFPGDDTIPLCVASILDQCDGPICSLPTTIRLEPASTFETEWAGFVLEAMAAPEACAGPCAGPCERRSPPRGPALEVWTALLEQPECEVDCECEPNAEGWCELSEPISGVSNTTWHVVEWPPACPVVELPLL